MLYPDFNELVGLKDQKMQFALSSRSRVKSVVPGDHHSPFRGQGLEFDAVREYVPGDDVRNIDWRVTARTGSPHLKVFREERERNLLLCVDMNSGMRFGTRKTFKSVQAARAASLLAWRGMANHDSVGACLFGDVAEGMQFFAPNRTRKSLWGMFKCLSNPSPEEHTVSIDEMVKHVNKAARTGSLIYVISDFIKLPEHSEHVLASLNKRCDVVFIAVNDPAETQLFPAGLLGFQEEGGEPVYVNTDSRYGRDAFAKQWKENRRSLYALAARLKIPLLELSTKSTIPRDLVLGLKQLGGRKTR